MPLGCSRRGVETTLSRGGKITIFGVLTKNIVMSDFDLINKRFIQQDKMIDLLRLRVEALENVMRKQIIDLDEKLAKEYNLLDPNREGKITHPPLPPSDKQ